jgi:hypothetical protein
MARLAHESAPSENAGWPLTGIYQADGRIEILRRLVTMEQLREHLTRLDRLPDDQEARAEAIREWLKQDKHPLVDDSCTWGEWCEREVERLRAKGILARVRRDGGLCGVVVGGEL